MENGKGILEVMIMYVFLIMFIMEVQLTCDVVFVSDTQHSDSTILYKINK